MNDLLDRHESGVARPRAYPDVDGFADVHAVDRFDRRLRHAELAGAISIVKGKGRQQDVTTRVDLENPERVYRHLGRVPARDAARVALEAVLSGLDVTVFSSDLEEVASAWSSNKRWSGLAPGDRQGLRTSLMLAQAILDRRHEGLDFRTFSRRVGGDSKALETLQQPIVRLVTRALEASHDGDPRAYLSSLGLDRFGPPLLLAGPVVLDDMVVPRTLPYIGLPATSIGRVSFTETPTYVLTVENQTSFNRQVLETDPNRKGLIIYTGGYPSLDIQRAISSIAASLPETPFFHWSDIDPEGIWIFRTVERAVGRPVSPHLMTAALAEAGGSPLTGSKIKSADFAQSAVAELASYFERPGARWLEQEELDPIEPDPSSRT
ncbi:Wadjet anti-phage system protein JetD domain-containing protein [Devosia sp.]|uniref:Wadjet anti-phage system protein JetD domain-containing protein n=1 Tax=Devosia sp. TaxID=1871048 RepID=UPI002AFFEE79|nr:Wadjet anti-phage system protein JetD domain-containing protein [Devosia sp.]